MECTGSVISTCNRADRHTTASMENWYPYPEEHCSIARRSSPCSNRFSMTGPVKNWQPARTSMLPGNGPNASSHFASTRFGPAKVPVRRSGYSPAMSHHRKNWDSRWSATGKRSSLSNKDSSSSPGSLAVASRPPSPVCYDGERVIGENGSSPWKIPSSTSSRAIGLSSPSANWVPISRASLQDCAALCAKTPMSSSSVRSVTRRPRHWP